MAVAVSDQLGNGGEESKFANSAVFALLSGAKSDLLD